MCAKWTRFQYKGEKCVQLRTVRLLMTQIMQMGTTPRPYKGGLINNKNHLPKCEYGEWPVRFMAGEIGHRSAPKIVLEHMTDRIDGQYILVECNGGYVIVDKVAIKTVQITGNGHSAHQTVNGP